MHVTATEAQRSDQTAAVVVNEGNILAVLVVFLASLKSGVTCCNGWSNARIIAPFFFAPQIFIHQETFGLQSSITRLTAQTGAECHTPSLVLPKTCLANIRATQLRALGYPSRAEFSAFPNLVRVPGHRGTPTLPSSEHLGRIGTMHSACPAYACYMRLPSLMASTTLATHVL